MSRRWLPVAWIAGVVGVVVIVSAFVGIGVMGTRDAPGLIDDQSILRAIDQGCQEVRRTMDRRPVRGDQRSQAAAIRRQNLAAQRMLERVEARGAKRIDADRPTRQWVEDWQRLIDNRARVADGLLDGEVRDQAVPRDPDGRRLDRRMNAAAAAAGCVVPRQFVEPTFDAKDPI